MHFFNLATKEKGVILGDGAATFPGPSGSDVTTVALSASYDTATFNIAINSHRMLYVIVDMVALGSVTALDVSLEFYDENWGTWIKSKGFDGSNHATRDDAVGTREWALTAAVGANFIVTSNEEHRHFKKARMRFKATGAVTAATHIRISWEHDGGPTPMASQ